MNKYKPEEMTISNCMKEMTSKESTIRAIRELVEFHIEAALKAAAEKAIINTTWHNNDWESEDPVGYTDYTIDKKSILSAYPEINIK